MPSSLCGASRSLDSVRMASKSTKKPPTTSSDGHESRRRREGAAAPRDAEIAPFVSRLLTCFRSLIYRPAAAKRFLLLLPQCVAAGPWAWRRHLTSVRCAACVARGGPACLVLLLSLTTIVLRAGSASFAAMFADWNIFASCRQRVGAFALPRRRHSNGSKESKWLKGC